MSIHSEKYCIYICLRGKRESKRSTISVLSKIESLALYGNEGRLIASEPVAVEKENIDVRGQDWYKNAESAIENVHFPFRIFRICMKMVCIVIIGLFH